MPPFARWSLWAVVAIVWTCFLVLPVTGPTFGSNEEMRELVRFLIAKTAHVSVYAFWAALTGWLRPPLRIRFFLLIFLMAHAVGTEWIQLHVPHRSGSLRDAALDQFGILIGVTLSLRWWTES